MINMLLALTEGETSGNYNTFIHSNYYCAMGILQDLWINNHALQETDKIVNLYWLAGLPTSLLQKGEEKNANYNNRKTSYIYQYRLAEKTL